MSNFLPPEILTSSKLQETIFVAFYVYRRRVCLLFIFQTIFVIIGGKTNKFTAIKQINTSTFEIIDVFCFYLVLRG